MGIFAFSKVLRQYFSMEKWQACKFQLRPKAGQESQHNMKYYGFCRWPSPKKSRRLVRRHKTGNNHVTR